MFQKLQAIHNRISELEEAQEKIMDLSWNMEGGDILEKVCDDIDEVLRINYKIRAKLIKRVK